MSKTVFTLDGVQYPGLHVTGLTRSFQIMDGENAGRLLNFEMVRDVGGTFYNYSMTIDNTFSDPADYDAFYDAISAPVDCHTLTVPYGQETLTFNAYITKGDDTLSTMAGGVNKWGQLSINFIAMSPHRRPA